MRKIALILLPLVLMGVDTFVPDSGLPVDVPTKVSVAELPACPGDGALYGAKFTVLDLAAGAEVWECTPSGWSAGGTDPCAGETNCHVVVDDEGDGEVSDDLAHAWAQAYPVLATGVGYRIETTLRGDVNITEPVTWCSDSSLPANSEDEPDCTGIIADTTGTLTLGRSFENVRFICDVSNSTEFSVADVSGTNIWARHSGALTGPAYCWRIGHAAGDGYGTDVLPQQVQLDMLGPIRIRQTFQAVLDTGALNNDFAMLWMDGVSGLLNVRFSGSQNLLAGNPVVVSGMQWRGSINEEDSFSVQNWAHYVLFAGRVSGVLENSLIGEGLGFGIGPVAGFGSYWAFDQNSGEGVRCQYGDTLATYRSEGVLAETVTLTLGSYGFEPFCLDDVISRANSIFTGNVPFDTEIRNQNGFNLTVAGTAYNRAATSLALQIREQRKGKYFLNGPVRMSNTFNACIQTGEASMGSFTPDLGIYGVTEVTIGEGFYCDKINPNDGADADIEDGDQDFIGVNASNYKAIIRAWNSEPIRWSGDLADVSAGTCLNLRDKTGSAACGSPETELRFDDDRAFLSFMRVHLHENPAVTGCRVEPLIGGAIQCENDGDNGDRPCWLARMDPIGLYGTNYTHPRMQGLLLNYDLADDCVDADDPYDGCTAASTCATCPTLLDAADESEVLMVNKAMDRGDAIEFRVIGAGCTDLPELELYAEAFALTPHQAYRGGNECEDGADNDGDLARDYPADPECASATDNDESS